MLDRNLIDSMKQSLKVVSVPQLFETPRELAIRMVELLELKSCDTVLEPSAGTGKLIDAIFYVDKTSQCSMDITAIENNSSLCRALLERYPTVNVYDYNFLAWNFRTFDKIVMNPPFKNLEDIEHVLHSYSMLNDGGILVAIMGEGAFFRECKKAVAFREFLDSVNADVRKLEAGTFKGAGTMVNTRLVILRKV